MTPATHELSPRSSKRFVRRVAAIAAIGGLLFGYDTGVISGGLLFIRKEFGLSPLMEGVVVSSLLIGATLGALVSGRLADTFGRRKVLLGTSAVFAIGAVLAGLAPDETVLVLGRVVLGLAIGPASAVVPLYIAEMVPADERGALVNFNQLMITIGIVVSYVVGFLYAPVEGWRWMLGLAVVPALLLGVGMLFLPETPRNLVSRNLLDQARAVLRSIHGKADVDGELSEIIAVGEQQRQMSSARGLLRDRAMRPMLITGVGLAVFSQIAGVNTIIYFAPSVLENSGFGASGSILAQVGIGLINVVLTVVAMTLIDRMGRRPMVISAFAGMGISMAVLGVAYLLPSQTGGVSWFVLGCMACYIAFFAFGVGTVLWLVIAEIYPLRVRGAAVGMAAMAVWLANFVVSLTFPLLIAGVGASITFWIFALVCALATAFCVRSIPETKRRSLENISDQEIIAETSKAT
ncbi:sugar porter family MFS transporter [Saccharopolyspora shandongensis]|uniref:sugar porter family MFS transporter n=1 Tax=Saccharopolyspora shandongensis TaxID=418495 RepID=UPI003444AE4D